MASDTRAVLRACLRSPRVNDTPLGPRFWTAQTLLHELASAAYFKAEWPHNYRVVTGDADGNAAALHALGGAVAFLRDSKLDARLVPLGCLEALPGCEGDGAIVGLANMQAVQELPAHMTLDGAALENLEVCLSVEAV